MKAKIILIIAVSVLLLTACQNGGNNNPSPSDGGSNGSAVVEENNTTESKPESMEPASVSFLNFDELEQYGTITATMPDYSDNDLKKLSKDESQKDYKVVIKKYVSNELKQNMSYMDTVDGTYNPRKVVVGTEEGNMYLFTLNKWHSYGGIWTVSSYAQYNHNDEAIPPSSVSYEVIDPDAVTEQTIQKEINERISAREEGQYYFNKKDVFYVLLVAGKNQSVELINVFGQDNYSLDVQYVYTENIYERYGEAPYILFKVPNVSIADLSFKQFSPVKIRDERPNLP
ncbi:hypothetical protein M6D81_08240 [Paenibacillus sp. J5C_2022]|uniref:hypothetical protein n=1 Tax=Paenibacillus sp. J5C2022 TaxID=2977129 RepID=UPI0021D0E778|nr:hypothetical protein [Paenibacillus sp. J5C2022]MCU6708706.1 hypothetical protein [Paenibacillus sp. J5C2022]